MALVHDAGHHVRARRAGHGGDLGPGEPGLHQGALGAALAAQGQDVLGGGDGTHEVLPGGVQHTVQGQEPLADQAADGAAVPQGGEAAE
ncbi:hypothetical protein ACFFX0_09795 [Citricoccus parietis]|uniref:Uncharacterized protein n=1 Tax=Citricoccus parietis TaxID=592307 RepID=A0ABV5FXR5_9MICC